MTATAILNTSQVKFNTECVTGNGVQDDACLGMTYDGPMNVKVTNPYNENIRNSLSKNIIN